jgi:hypothetical protein
MGKIGLPHPIRLWMMHGVFEEVSRGIRPFKLPWTQPRNVMSKYTDAVVSQRRAQFLSSWQEFAPGVTIAGFTLAQFEEESMPPLDARKEMADVKTKLKGLKLKRDKADEALTKLLVLIAHGIRGNELFGEDCEFYRSLGFVPKSERKTGMSRRNKKVAPPPPDADAA